MSRPRFKAGPLQWPFGWRRTLASSRTRGRFSEDKQELTVDAAEDRVLDALRLMGADHIVISLDDNARDPGVVVSWHEGKHAKEMAVDTYDRPADNLAAIATTLQSMRNIERHGGAQIYDRATAGFDALPNPDKTRTWREVLGYEPDQCPDIAEVEGRYRALAFKQHPDRGGSNGAMSEINKARDEARSELA